MRGKRVVVLGAASGVGRATAELLARKGARLTLLDLHDEAESLAALTRALSFDGHDVSSAAVTPGDRSSLDAQLGEGGVDAWVNAVSRALEADAEEAPLEPARRIVEATFWTTVHGCELAVERMRGRGGVLVNVGSIHSDRGFPMHGAQGAAGHALKAYTDALRMELSMQRVPVKVSLVKAGLTHRYAPEVTARAVLALLERPRRHLTVGGATSALSTLERFVPSVLDKLVVRGTSRPLLPLRRRRSLYTQAKLHRAAPIAATAALLVARHALRSPRLA